jgi:hypothetical protein
MILSQSWRLRPSESTSVATSVESYLSPGPNTYSGLEIGEKRPTARFLLLSPEKMMSMSSRLRPFPSAGLMLS